MKVLNLHSIFIVVSIVLGLLVACNAYFDQQNAEMIGGACCEYASGSDSGYTCPSECSQSQYYENSYTTNQYIDYTTHSYFAMV